MLLLVGLGNPGPERAGNRHNIGFLAVDAIARTHRFGPWRSRFEGMVAEGLLATDRDASFQNKVHLAMQAKGFGEPNDDGGASEK